MYSINKYNRIHMTDIYTTPDKLNLAVLDAKSSFTQLNDKEKQYTYWMYKAAWSMSKIIAQQVSPESLPLLDLFTNIFTNRSVTKFKTRCKEFNFTDKNIEDFLNYTALLFLNNGNYRSFGDSKIVPRLDKNVMRNMIKVACTEQLNDYNKVENAMYSLKDHEKLLGFPPKGTTGYYTDNLTETEIDTIDEYLTSKGIEGWNTRISKVNDLCIVTLPAFKVDPTKHVSIIDKYKGLNITLSYRDYSDELEDVVLHLKQALKYTANKHQENMINSYIKHFTYGDLQYHKESQRHWIKDKGPVVETNMGFIENYRDPAGIRAEAEAFVSVVDKEKSKKLKQLVDRAPELITSLPWPAEFEKDTFNPPDFTSLDVVTFAGSGIPAGINIPNYDDIRQTEGFKNVSLNNVILASHNVRSNESVDYLDKEDEAMYKKHSMNSFFIDVAGHELLGHGSGKLFTEDSSGNVNFNKETVINPLTYDKIKTWYKTGETYSNKFGRLGSSYEECRAECVGLYLSNNKLMHELLGNKEDKWEDVMYTSWLWMVRAGICSMQSYDVDKKKWMQAHSQARFVIYKMLSEAGLVETNLEDNNFIVKVDRSKIKTLGIPALQNFLLKLNVYKCTADYDNAARLYDHYSTVDESDLKLRTIHMNRRKPRIEYVQPVLFKDQYDRIHYKEFDSTPESAIESFVTKYCDDC